MGNPDQPDDGGKTRKGLLPLLGEGFTQATRRVEEMHQAISGQTYEILNQIPIVSGPSGLIGALQANITGSVYATVRTTGEALFQLAQVVEPLLPLGENNLPPADLELNFRSIINGVIGDYLAATNNPLAIPMALIKEGQVVPAIRENLSQTFPNPRRNLAVFLHGLCFDERCWLAEPEKVANGQQTSIPALIEDLLRSDVLFVRYNTGLTTEENGEKLNALLSELVDQWPVALDNLYLIGHSMGGLLIRWAEEKGHKTHSNWAKIHHHTICLGSPHLGAPLERVGQVVTLGLQFFDQTAALGKIAEVRSAGIKDLRYGPLAQTNGQSFALPLQSSVQYYFCAANMADDPDQWLGHLIGDGLVTLNSAEFERKFPNVKSQRVGAMGHMHLLTHSDVAEQIKTWLG